MNMTRKAHVIMATQDPYQIKKLYRDIPQSPKWYGEKDEVLYQLMKSKFQQNPALKGKLLDTKNLQLYEATKDRRYACGYSIKEKKKINASIPGENITGKILMRIRDELK